MHIESSYEILSVHFKKILQIFTTIYLLTQYTVELITSNVTSKAPRTLTIAFFLIVSL